MARGILGKVSVASLSRGVLGRRGRPELLPAEEQEYEELELDEPETIALNSIEELDDTADAGHAIQLQLAAHAAVGKAKGRGKTPKRKGHRER